MPTPLRRAHTAAAVLLAFAAVALCAPATLHAAAQPRLIVGFTPTATPTQRTAVAGRAALSAKRSIPHLNATVVAVRPGHLAAARRALQRRPGVAFVEVDHVARAYGTAHAAWQPNDTFFSSQWALARIGAPQAWDTTRGAGVTVAVLDTGVDYIHPDLAGRVDKGRDFVDDDDDPMDVQGHGTHVAGTVAAAADDSLGIAGVAPDARILAVRVLDAEGAGNYSQVARGIVYAADQGAKVINLSLGGDEQSELLRAAIDYAFASGAIVTCATGNESRRRIGYPARYDSCIAVGASTQDDGHAHFSNRGDGIDIAAPGTDILSSTMGGSHESWDGTSMASPHVAGVAALLRAQGLTQRAALDALLGTTADLGPAGADTTFGRGRLDAAAATAAGARQPRAGADSVAPTAGAPSMRPVRRTVNRRLQVRWKLASRTGFRRVGTTDYAGDYAYTKRIQRGNRRTIDTYRYRHGIVYRRRIVQLRTRRMVRQVAVVLPVTLAPTDDQGVDRVAVAVDGRIAGLDRDHTDGWSVTVPCTPGVHRFTSYAWDAADNRGSSSVTRRIRC